MGKIGKREGIGAIYGGGLKFVCLGLVIRQWWYVSYYSRPAGDENEYDDVNLSFDRWAMPGVMKITHTIIRNQLSHFNWEP